MREQNDISQSFLDEIGGEPLEGSGFEHEISDPSFETDRNPTNPKRQRSVRKEERGDAE